MILKLALILILFGIIFVSAALGKKLDEMNDRITKTHKMALELRDKIEKLEKEKMYDHSQS